MNTEEHVYQDLFDRSLLHQTEHGDGCTVFPTPQAPLWAMMAAALSVTRVLEIGCGIGYQTACLASAAPDVLVETIENDPLHADLAQAEFERLGLSNRITILRGDAESFLPDLDGPYGLVMEDAGIDYDRWLPDLTRLTGRGGLLITSQLAGRLPGWDPRLPTEALTIVRANFSYPHAESRT
ncbi:MAG: class I SAM-dependent methyltransferase [Chloroflexi bacterium]|nr:class I SAM-dependent methyltransferase [Chloroflexota bacterium]